MVNVFKCIRIAFLNAPAFKNREARDSQSWSPAAPSTLNPQPLTPQPLTPKPGYLIVDPDYTSLNTCS